MSTKSPVGSTQTSSSSSSSSDAPSSPTSSTASPSGNNATNVSNSTSGSQSRNGGGSSTRQRPVITDCQVVGTQLSDDAVHYVIKVMTANETWCCHKRYSMFEEFHTMLLDNINERSLPAGAELPGKRLKVWYSHTSPQFIEERAILLENYLKKLCMVKDVAGSELFVGFLATDMMDVNPASLEVKTPLDKVRETQLPDDVEVTAISVPGVRTMPDHVLYHVEVVNERKRRSFQKWMVLKRFNQFVEMDEAVRANFAHRPDVLAALPSPPEKFSKILYDHLDDHFIEQRRVLLENYMQKMMLVTPVLYDPDFLAFLGVNV